MYDNRKLIGSIVNYHNKTFGDSYYGLSRLAVNYIYYILNVVNLEKNGELLVKDPEFKAGKVSPYTDTIYPDIIIDTFNIKLSSIQREPIWNLDEGSFNWKEAEFYEVAELPSYFEEICFKYLSYGYPEISNIWVKDPNYKYVLESFKGVMDSNKDYNPRSLNREDLLASAKYLSET